jgi:hypothetical protein
MNNPPAFPQPNHPPTWAGGEGMTLRDYFAAKAMQAILQNDPDYHQKHQFLDLADFAYRCADAMLKAREV